MKVKQNSFVLPFLFLSLGFLVAGCGISPGEDVAEVDADADAKVVASKVGCCGQCASAAAAAADEKAASCCGGCAKKEESVATQDEPCGDCTACAEGDSGSCKR